jgi:cytidylate kinase
MNITISRQYAAGSSEVARRVADQLGWTVLDDELIDQVAERSGLSREEVEELEERIPTFIERVAQTNALAFPDLMIGPAELVAEPEQAKLARVTRSVIEELGQRSHLVMVGRAAAAVLGRRSDALHVKLVAGREWRIQRAIERLGVAEAKAAQIVDDRDRNRLHYHREFYARDWADPVNYHMTLNTERLGFDVAAGIVVAAARALGW